MAIADVKYFAVVFLLTLLIAVPGAQQQEPQPDPHSLAYCVNHAGYTDYPMVEPHICECEYMEDGTEDRKCKTFCRRDKCMCIHERDQEPRE